MSMASKIRSALAHSRQPMRARELAEQIKIPSGKLPSFYGGLIQLYAIGEVSRVDRGTYVLSARGFEHFQRDTNR